MRLKHHSSSAQTYKQLLQRIWHHVTGAILAPLQQQYYLCGTTSWINVVWESQTNDMEEMVVVKSCQHMNKYLHSSVNCFRTKWDDTIWYANFLSMISWTDFERSSSTAISQSLQCQSYWIKASMHVMLSSAGTVWKQNGVKSWIHLLSHKLWVNSRQYRVLNF